MSGTVQEWQCYENQGTTFRIIKRIDTKLLIDGMAALYITRAWLSNTTK